MKKVWIFAGCLIVAAGAAWTYRDRIPYLSTAFPAGAKQAATGTESASKDGDGANQNQGQNRRRGGGPPPVVKTIAATMATLPLDATAVGAADADKNTTIAAQEAGIIVSISAHDGDTVKTGDLIAKLDDRTVKANLDKDKALLARDQATLSQAETALTRAETLVSRNAGTQQTADEARAARDTALATMQSDKASIAADQVAVEHTDIRAPFDGKLGDIGISTGAYLSTGAAIVTIAQYDPIFVKFHLPQMYLPLLQAGFASKSVTVDAVSQSDGTVPVSGVLDFFDNTIDAASGTILAKARFDNPKGTLWPGESVNVTAHFKSDKQMIIVPTVAINPGADQPFVYTVGDDKKVHMTPVTVARSNGDRTGITKGLKEGDHVVVEGQVQLVNGSPIREEFSQTPDVAALKHADGSVEVGDAAAVTAANGGVSK
ncbi:MAG: efflux RND transporter periplasmic adaptor subunit [Neorhizobium sp.]|nr:efflux RND transporter periplasmic adaptor subunit [Neorhizobium sp.]